MLKQTYGKKLLLDRLQLQQYYKQIPADVLYMSVYKHCNTCVMHRMP